jgi:hypothetical protein
MQPEVSQQKSGGLGTALAWMRDLTFSVLIAVVLIARRRGRNEEELA